ncbi:MAG: hypothetical protein L0Y58_04895 [Verrucomicrobia subdivision 3 bacterium]|nr:hypothetical protein [Limisphaerales bacterium]
MEENFERLQKVLALKRYERPPPGYFNNFSTKVLARIESATAVQPLGWWQRLGLEFDFRPALVCALGVVVCALLSAGVMTAVVGGPEQANALNAMAPSAFSGPTAGSMFDTAPASTQPVFAPAPVHPFGAPVAPASLPLTIDD